MDADGQRSGRVAALRGNGEGKLLRERAVLRREYIDSVTGGLKAHLDNTYLMDEKGNKTKLKKKADK